MTRAVAGLYAVLALGCASAPVSSPNSGISEADAIETAERFVKQIGHARVAPSSSQSPSVRDSADAEAISLAPKACGVIATNVRYQGAGWTVTFCYDPWHAKQMRWQTDLRARQRLVVMDPRGGNVELVHEDLPAQQPGLKVLRQFDDQASRVEIGEREAIFAATQFIQRTGFVVGIPTNPERDWSLPNEPTAPVRAKPRLPLWSRACAIVPRDLRSSTPGWTVGFCYDPYIIQDRRIALENLPERLRFVAMDAFGEGIDMLDEDGGWTLPGLKRLREPPK